MGVRETGGKGDRLMGERKTDNSLPSDKAAGQNVMEGMDSEAVIEGMRKRASVFVEKKNKENGQQRNACQKNLLGK